MTDRWHWYIQRDGQQTGPVSSDELRALAAAGRLRPDDRVRRDGQTQWIHARDVRLPAATVREARPARGVDVHVDANADEDSATDGMLKRWLLGSVMAANAVVLLAFVAVMLNWFGGGSSNGGANTLLPVANAAEPSVTFGKSIAPLLGKYCIDCHSGKKPKSGLDLSVFHDEASVLDDRDTWLDVYKKLRSYGMPPAKKPQPTPHEHDLIVNWIDETLNHVDCDGPINPGRVTIRRLNRVEYRNTVRDLIGVDYAPAADFPVDDVGYGFDNIGDVLSISPLHMEKYLAAAEDIASKAIQDQTPRKPTKDTYAADTLRTSSGAGAGGGTVTLSSESEVFIVHRFKEAGRYAIRVMAHGELAGPQPPRVMLQLDGKELKVFDVTAPRKDPKLYEQLVQVEAGRKRISAAFINDYYKPDDPDPANRDRNLVIHRLEVEGPLDVAPKLIPQAQRLIGAEPGDGVSDQDAARQVITRFVTRAFRRPAEDEQVNRLIELFKLAKAQGDSFEDGIQLAVQAVLVSPQFLFRIEDDRPPDDPAHPEAGYSIDDFELASRLSYFLWSSMPDEELFALARDGKLRQPGVLEAQAKRMIADPKSSALAENFAGQWLETRKLATVTPDTEAFPDFDEPLRKAMATETTLFFDDIMRNDRSLVDFLDADYTFVNERLARYYGIAGVQGDAFQRVSLTGTHRGGVVTQASVLTVTSNPTRTSPVKRGKWVMENLLGTPPPDPPANVPPLKEGAGVELTGTLRQRMEQHRADPVCASCHRQMDAIGFAFENFDAIGAWRTRDGKFDIDPSGTLPDGREIQGPAQLRQILKSDKDLFIHCLAEKMLTYALGRGLERYDKCAVDKMCKQVAGGGYRFSSLVTAIVQSIPFQKRRGKEVSDE